MEDSHKEIIINEKSDCCGCGVCHDVCPKGAISMVADEEGFKYPRIDYSKCIQCGLCLKSCCFRNKDKKKEIYLHNFDMPFCYGAKAKDCNIRATSRSGGVFFLLAEQVIKEGGVVYGCSMSDDFEIRHDRAATLTECRKFQNSKYCQSDTVGIWKKALSDIGEGREVLFSGTSCQTAAFRNYVHTVLEGRTPSNLFTVDILCRGVPSGLLWNSYRKYIEKRWGSEIQAFIFRNKEKYGWRSHKETFWIDGKEYASDMYAKLFLSNVFMRPSCYKCRYKRDMHPADITLGDFWAVDKALPGFDDNKGVSLVLVNSEIGQRLFKNIEAKLESYESSLDDCRQGIFLKPISEPKRREYYWKQFLHKDIHVVSVGINRRSRIDGLIRTCKRRMIKVIQLIKDRVLHLKLSMF